MGHSCCSAQRTRLGRARGPPGGLARGEGIADPRLAEVLANEAPEALRLLRDWGVTFPRTAEGKLQRRAACFSTAPRAVVADSAESIQQPLARVACRLPTLTARVDQLLIGVEGVFGAMAVDSEGIGYELLAKSVVLATGGGGGLFENALAPAHQLAEGHGMALSIGLQLENLEFIQVMLGTFSPRAHDFYPLPLLTGGARLLDGQGNDLLDRLPAGVDRQQVLDLRPGHAPFSCSDLSGHLDRLIASVDRPTLEAGGQRHVVAPHAHSWCGGAPIDSHGRTTIPGLLAAGETATGMHGANRLGGNQIAACMVFGGRAGREAARQAARRDGFDEQALKVARRELTARQAPGADPQPRLGSLRQQLSRILTRAALILRSGPVLAESLIQIEQLQLQQQELRGPDRRSVAAISLFGHSLLASQALVAAALARTESRGAHFREDHPQPGQTLYRVGVRSHNAVLMATKTPI